MEPVTPKENDGKPFKTKSNFRTIDQALAIAEGWFEEMDGSTRVTKRKVESVSYLTSENPTRASVMDTLMYLINYKDEGGFALIGRKDSSREIYAISQEGRLLVSDTVYNKGLA